MHLLDKLSERQPTWKLPARATVYDLLKPYGVIPKRRRRSKPGHSGVIKSLPSTATVGVKPVFTRIFQEYGLPKYMRSDNGVPFATSALCRLSALSAWWIQLGIISMNVCTEH